MDPGRDPREGLTSVFLRLIVASAMQHHVGVGAIWSLCISFSYKDYMLQIITMNSEGIDVVLGCGL